MVVPHLGSADAKNNFEDLSGVDIASYANPYDALIIQSQDDPVKRSPSHGLSETLANDTSKVQIQNLYETHRTTRNGQQRAKLLSLDFSGLILDPILQKLTDLSLEPGFKDPRHCIVFWARPPAHIRALVDKIQQQLLTLAPSELKILCVSMSFLKASLS